MQPEKKNYWDEVADTWEQSSQQNLLRLVSDQLNNQLFRQWLPQKKVNYILKTDLFDESLSNGLKPLLSEYTHSFIGVDLSLQTIHKVKDKHRQLNAIVADVRHLPFKSGAIDLIVSNSTLDHFKTRLEIVNSLKELNRVLKNKSQLLITLDNMANPCIFIRNILPYQLLNRLGIVPYFIGKSYSPFRLKRALKELNFSVVEITAFWHFPRIFLNVLAAFVAKYFSGRLNKFFLDKILIFEYLSKLSTKYFTGQFVAARAIKRS